jgi:cysteine synthase A
MFIIMQPIFGANTRRTIPLKVVENVLDLIGETPMIRLAFEGIEADLFAKLEYLNPGGSVKDRIAKQMIDEAEKRGDIKPGYTIVEATSGNTGIALSLAGAAKGYKVVIVVPGTASSERRSIMKHYGAEVVLTPPEDFVEGAVAKARELATQPGWWMPSQFENPDNVAAHREKTGKEILEQVPGGRVDAFLAGIGTGGTLMGVAEALKAANPRVKIMAVEPVGLRAEAPKEVTKHLSIIKHKVEGIGDGFIPQIVSVDLIDDWMQVCDEDAIETACTLAREKGLFVGISSGANVYASLQVAKNLGKGKVVVTVLPDNADRYYTTALFKKSCCERSSKRGKAR